jgi:hypothetical protein
MKNSIGHLILAVAVAVLLIASELVALVARQMKQRPCKVRTASPTNPRAYGSTKNT